MSRVPAWLARADEILGDAHSSEEIVDRVVDDIGRLEVTSTADMMGVQLIDPVVLQRVIAALTARRAAVAVELADLGRQRSELARRHRGVAGYTQSGS